MRASAAAVLVAAGPGTRLGAGVPKAFVELAGTPLVIHSLRALLSAPSIESVVVVVSPSCLEDARQLLDRHGPWRCNPAVAPGGPERRDSVRNGLAATGSAELIAIHDAARPFVSREAVEAAVAAAALHGAAIVGTPAVDTVKRLHPDGWIESTLPRRQLWLAQTPQVFRADLIRAAHAQPSIADDATDDAMLAERLGTRVYVVPGNPENRKITTPEDLRWAEWVLTRPPGSR